MSYRAAVGACCFVLVTAAPGEPANALSVEAYLDLAKRKEAGGSLDRYFDGLRDGVFDYNAAMLSAGIKVFCPPAESGLLATPELRSKVDAWLRGTQRTKSAFAEYAKRTSVGLVVLEVLNDLYACPDEQGGPEDEVGTPR